MVDEYISSQLVVNSREGKELCSAERGAMSKMKLKSKPKLTTVAGFQKNNSEHENGDLNPPHHNFRPFIRNFCTYMGSFTPKINSVVGSLATEPVPQSALTCLAETTVVQLRQLRQVQLFLTVPGNKFSSSTVTMILCVFLRVHGNLILYS